MSSISLITQHIIHHLAHHRTAHASAELIPPLFVGFQGPQGSGKTYTTSQLEAHLAQHGVPSIVTLSLDDLYLPYEGLVDVARRNPTNILLQGRGLPGTHDLDLAREVFTSLRAAGRPTDPASPPPSSLTLLPRFLKSLNSGLGDRLPPHQSTLVRAPVDVVIFEGWCLGFLPLGTERLSAVWDGPAQGVFRHAGREAIESVEHELAKLAELWTTLDCFVQLCPPSLEMIYTWRQEQETELQAHTQTPVMSPAQVRSFVDRYMPAYELWSGGVRAPGVSWQGKGLALTLGAQREVVDAESF